MKDAEVCEKCGKLARNFTCDTVEIASSADSAGKLWREWLPDKKHAYCDDHYEKPTRTYLDGHIEQTRPEKGGRL